MRDPRVVTVGSVEDSYLVLRHPLARASVPKAKGIVLINRPTHSELSFPSGLVALKESTTDTSWERVIQVILDEPLQDRSGLVVVLGGRVFWDIGGVPEGHNHYIPGGWISLRLGSRDEPKRVLQDAMRVFGIEEQHVLDLRLTEEELARVPTVTGQFSSDEVSEIQRTVFAMARFQIMQRLVVSGVSRQGLPEEWTERWPGRHALTIKMRPDGRSAVVYYGPNVGYQMERINGKWTIVGG